MYTSRSTAAQLLEEIQVFDIISSQGSGGWVTLTALYHRTMLDCYEQTDALALPTTQEWPFDVDPPRW